nr:putative Ig domain-containing protein [Notoacmeibacter sp. MSK16QG-6]
MTGSASKATYQEALNAIRFKNSSENPDTTLREIHVKVNDGTTGSPVAKAFIEVQGRNDPPVLVSPIADQTAIDGADAGSISVVALFTDADGEALTYSLGPDAPPWLAIDPATGIVSNIAAIPIDASQQTNAAGNPAGTYTVTVVARDAGDETATDTFDIVVTNPEPTAFDDRLTMSEDDGVLTDHVMNDNGAGADTDPDGDPLTVTAVGGAEADVGRTVAGSGGGLFTILPDGSFTFKENSDFQHLVEGENTTSWISYRITDADGASSAALVEVTIQGVNDAPTVTDNMTDRVGTDGESVGPLDLSTFFSDVDGNDSLTFSATGLPKGLAIDPAAGILSGVLAGDASQTGNTGVATDGLYTVTVTAEDLAGETVSQSFFYKVGNPDPVAKDDILTVTDQGTGSLNVITDDNGNGIDSDPDGDTPLIVTAIDGDDTLVGTTWRGSAGGLFTVLADGAMTFDTNGEFVSLPKGDSVTTSFTYRLSDGQGGTSTATVTVIVIGENQPPEPQNPDGRTPGDPSAYIPVQSLVDGQTAPDLDLTPFARDPDRGDTLTFTIDETALPAGLGFDGTTISGLVTADASQAGTDPLIPGVNRIPLTVTDSHGASFSTWIVYDVSNVPPVATDNISSGDAVEIQTGNVITNPDGPDRDGTPDADPLTVTQIASFDPSTGTVHGAIDVSSAASATIALTYGELTMSTDGAWRFVPNAAAADLPPGSTVQFAILYRVSDGQGGSDDAVLRIVIEAGEDGNGKPPEDIGDPDAEREGDLRLSSGEVLGILDVVEGNRTFHEALLQRQQELAGGDAIYRGAEVDVATGAGPADKLTVRSLVWRDSVYVELLGPVIEWSATDATGRALPDWIRQTDTNLIAVSAGNEHGANSIVISTAMRDGRMFHLPLRVDQATGDMSVGQISEVALIDRSLAEQLSHERDRDGIGHAALLQALEN